MTLEKYFHIVNNLLETHSAIVDQKVSYTTFTKDNGIIKGRILLRDNSYIDFLEEVFVTKKMIVKGKYHYQFVKEEAVFRYDNYSRHPGISAPFHHKHTSAGIIQLKDTPKLVDVIAEATRYIFA